MRKITKESRNKLESGMNSYDLQDKPAGQILTYTPHWPIVHQLETATQDQINQEYTSTQTLFTTFTQPCPTEATSTSHPKNNSILQGATSSPVDQFATNATDVAGRNEPWR